MELVTVYLFERYIGKKNPLPFPQYLLPENRHKNDFWITQEGECIYPWDMENRHLVNTVNLIHRGDPGIQSMYDECKADEYVLYGKAPWVTKNGKKQKGNLGMTKYFLLWDNKRIYMLLRREIKLRELEDYI